jgi:uncharacterized phiE125 gp8 family phage protein
MNVTTLVAPAAEPLGLAEAKQYLRIAYAGEDDLVSSLIKAARARVEFELGMAMVQRTLRLTRNDWPIEMLLRSSMRLPVRPVVSLSAVRVKDREGELQTVTGQFALSGGVRPRLVWILGNLPETGLMWDAVEIDFVAGFGEDADDVPDDLKLAVKLLVAAGYQARDEAGVLGKLPGDVRSLLAPWRRVML